MKLRVPYAVVRLRAQYHRPTKTWRVTSPDDWKALLLASWTKQGQGYPDIPERTFDSVLPGE